MPPTSQPPRAQESRRGTDDGTYDPSLCAFFNALIKETDLATYEEGQDRPSFVVDLPEGDLIVPCVHRSQTGRHGLRGPCYHRADRVRPVAFPEAVRLASRALPGKPEDVDLLVRRVLRSRRNLEDAVADRLPDLERLFEAELGFVEAEQGLLAGHSVHPCPKDRGGTGPTQGKAWAACHASSFHLVWLAADRQRVTVHASEDVQPTSLLGAFAAPEIPQALDRVREEELVIPAHPYQLHRWRAHPGLAEGFDDGSLRVLGEGSRVWRPTSSVRTLFAEEAAWMVKVSLSLKLTNSLRHLHLAELARGPRFTDLLASPEARTFTSRFPDLAILEEPVSLALQDEDGRPLEETGVAWRTNPFLEASSANTEVLATLLQDDPRDGEPRLVKRLRAVGHGDRRGALRWFERFLATVVRPFLLAHADHGIVFGAHQQNLVLSLDGIWPKTVYFRDCQGVGFSPLGQDRHGDQLATWEEGVALVFDRGTAAALLGYYLVVNSVFNVIASLARSGWIREGALVERLAGFLDGLRSEGLRDGSLVRMLLDDPELWMKGNLHYALQDIDETTQSCDVLDLYRPIRNPIPGVRA